MYTVAKRGLDVLVSALALTVLIPLLAIIAIAVKLDSPGPVFFLGRRIGLYGKTFHIFKFRTMIVGADSKGSPITTRQDPRITRIGHLLRRWKLDELPNLVNVLLGDMSLVGPRPESPSMVELYTSEQRKVLTMHPGIACLAQIRFPNEQAILGGQQLDEAAYLKHMGGKLDLDLLYVRTALFWGDLVILICTVLALLGIQIDLESFFRARLRAKSASTTSGG